LSANSLTENVVAAVVAGTGKLSRLFCGQHLRPPKDLNTPPIAFVETIVEYLVRVLIAQAVTCEQSHLVNGYTVVVSPPILKATGIAIVAVVGIVCAITIQYLQPSLYALTGKSITSVSVPSTVITVTDVEIIKFLHNLQLGLQAIFILLLLKSKQGHRENLYPC
jgi:hypothetical protein